MAAPDAPATTRPVCSDDLLVDGDPGRPPILVLAHGAGASMDSDWMNQVAAAVASRGLTVVRFEFPYMSRRRIDGRRRGPDRTPVLLETWREVVQRLGGGSRLVLGGKSMGGRIASMIADEVGALGLVCLGYPFHPPGRPERLRVAHLTDLSTPALILQGTRDPFGTPEQVARYPLSGSIQVHWLADGDHSLRPRVRSGRTLADNLDEAADRIVTFVAEITA